MSVGRTSIDNAECWQEGDVTYTAGGTARAGDQCGKQSYIKVKYTLNHTAQQSLSLALSQEKWKPVSTPRPGFTCSDSPRLGASYVPNIRRVCDHAALGLCHRELLRTRRTNTALPSCAGVSLTPEGPCLMIAFTWKHSFAVWRAWLRRPGELGGWRRCWW